ncbi:mucin-5AC isoform X5 [Drosophila subpulchrella]|uniref:mucin-5AC isoform X5 n=1 Tax=Drosophila subpulchrella TaxID=1486046 RepID=UPI0018A1B327|nr:mucin-5AC isoform X5 [Drosophila subpulchrella]
MLPFRRGAAWQTLFLLCALAYCINEASSEGRVVCYYTNWSVYRPGTAKFNPQNINPYLCTHLVYAFGGFTKDNQMKPFDKYQDIEQGGYAKFTGLKTYNKQLKTMIAIGGWNEASSRFSPLVASNERRQQFIKNILKFLRQNHFDGIDLDWEYPAHREGGKSRDRDNYAQFVQELRAEFEREAEKTGRTRLLLTMAVPAGIEYIDKGYDVPKLNKYLDWFNVLTYDFHSSHEPSVNHHAPLYSLEEDSEYNYDAELNIDYSIKYYLKAGADRDKLVLGIPTYGRSYTLINEESTELGAPSEGPGEQGDATREKGYLAYYEICQTLKDDPEWTVVQPNANVMGPYAYRRNQWVGYDDEAIVRKKAEYVVAQGLGGIMFWAIDNDDFRGTCNGKPYPLIEAAKEAMVEALGLGINEVAKPSGPQKPSRSRSRDNASTRNRLNGKTEAPASSRRPSATRRPAVSSTTQAPPPSTTFKLTEAEGSSLYIGGRASTTPPPPTTPDPGSDFKCEEEGFFQHPRDCKKYYWCLDSGPSGLGIVAHMFTCPSGLYFNPAADSCDFARNVPCKTKKSTTVAPVTSTTPTTTTVRSNRVTAAPTARPVYPRTTTSTTTSTTTTTTSRPATFDEDLEYEEDTDELSPSKSTDAEEDPQVIKELIDLIRKVGGVEQLEKHLLRNKDGSITLKENSASGAATTPSTISKSLYDRVLSRPGTLSSFTRNRFKISEATETSTEPTVSSSGSPSGSSSGTSNSYSKYSSVLRGNSRQGPQNEGIEKLAEFDGFLKERKQYVTINRHRSASQGDEEEHADQQEEEENLAVVETTTRRPLSSVTPSYTSLRRTRPTTVAPPAEESHEEAAEQQTQTQVKSYATLSRNRGRTTAPPEVTESAPSSTTNRYKYFERTRPTKSATAEDAEDPTEDEEEEYDEEQKEIVTVQSKQTTNTRKYASIGRRTTTTTTATPETTTTTAGTETAKASTTTNNNYNNNNHYNSSNNNNNVKLNNLIPTEENNTATPSTTAQSETTSTTTNETTEPNESTSTTTTSITNNLHITTTTPTPIVASTVPTTTTSNGINSDSLLATELSETSPTQLPPNPDIETTTPTTTTSTTTTTESELASTTTTPKTTTTTTGNNELNDVNNVDEDSEVTKPKTQYKYATTNRRRITTTTTTTTTNNNNNNAEAASDASPVNGLSSLNSIRTNPGRRQPQPEQTQTTTTEPNLSSPRPFGYPRRRTRPTASTTTTTISQTDNNDNNTDNNDNETDAVAQVVKKTRLSAGDRPKNRYQLSRTRGSTTNTTPTTTTTQQPQTTTTARRLAFGGRQRAQDQSLSSTTQAPPPATTLLHVFTLLEGEGPEEEPTTRRPTQARLHPTIQTEVVPKHKLIEINRIVEINSKQAKAAQRKSKANQDFGTLRVESLPHVEQLGEISVVKYVHLVDGSDIQINDGHSTVADYTPTEPTLSASQSPASAPVRNSLPETEGGTDTDRNGKSLVPEVLTGALETSTISLEGLFDSARKGKQLSSNSIIGETETEESTTISSSSASATETRETTTPAPTYLRQPATGSVSRRPVLSVRRRIINSPTSAAVETTTQQPAEPPTTSKYNRLRSRPSAAASAAAATTTAAAAAATTSYPAATSAAGGRTSSNIYLNKLKAKSGAAAAASGEAATLTPATSNISSSSSSSNINSSNISSNDITQKQHKFQPASFALRRQFQTRRLTTFAPAANGDESATDVPRTQNPLFKRRLTLISTTPPSARTTNSPNSGLETTTTLYLSDDDEDQVAKSSIHTSRFNQIPEQVRPREEFELALPPAAPQPLKSTTTTASTTANAPLPVVNQGIRRQLIPRPRRPQSTTATPLTTPTLGSSTPAGHSAPPLSRRQQSRRRPHKYIEVYSRPPAKSAVLTATSSSQLLEEGFPGQSQVAQRRRSGSISPAKGDPKVIVHGRGIIECRAQGNFPHPLNCRKFISCARFEETGGIVGWEYTCPKGLTYDGVGGMCTWSPSDQPCRD